MIFTSLSQYSVGDLECKVQCIFHFLLHFMIESNSNAQWLVTNITIVIWLSQIFVRLFTDLFALAMICTFSPYDLFDSKIRESHFQYIGCIQSFDKLKV